MKKVTNIETITLNIIDYMTKPGPFLFGRISGCETNLIKYYSELKQNYPNPTDLLNYIKTNASFKEHVNIVKKYAGYYDTENQVENDIKFCEFYLKCMKDYDAVAMAGPDTASYYLHPELKAPYDNPAEKKKFDVFIENYFNPESVYYPYFMFENQYLFLSMFKKFAENKKILVISPFSKSIHLQEEKLPNLINGYTYPSFELITYNTHITYSAGSKPLIGNSFPHKNWFETFDAMCNDIAKIDFDIALLSCASYAAPIGSFIRSLGKKAIYTGGVTQTYFGVMGTRWITDRIYLENKDKFIFPIETTDEINTAKQNHTNSEGFCAYF